MFRAIAKSFSGLIHNKLILLAFVLAGLATGIIVQLIWINTYCARYSIWGADIFPCRENTLRIWLGGPLGLIAITLLYSSVFSLFYKANPHASPLRMGSRLALCFCGLVVNMLIPVLDYRRNDLVFLMSLLTCAVCMRVFLREEFGQVGNFLRNLVYKKPRLSYRMRMKDSCLSIEFSGDFSEQEREYLHEQLLEDLLQVREGVREVQLVLQGARGFDNKFDFIIYYVKGFCSIRQTELRIIAAANQKRVLNRMLHVPAKVTQR